MGILGSILEGITAIGSFVVDVVSGAFSWIKSALGFKPRPPREFIRAELRKQWLALAPGETEIPGVEYEGEIYYETPR